MAEGIANSKPVGVGFRQCCWLKL